MYEEQDRTAEAFRTSNQDQRPGRDAGAGSAQQRSGTALGKSDQVVPVLTKLLHISMDGVKGFREAAEKVEPPYEGLLLRLADEREQIAHDLREQIGLRAGMGQSESVPEEKGDTLGALHRGWIGLKAALGGGAKAIIDECERGEDAAVKAYQEAINESSLPPDVEILLNRQYALIKNAHDQVRDIKQAPQ